MNAGPGREPVSSLPPDELRGRSGDEVAPRAKRFRKEEIVATATKLFAERGYEGTSMGDLAARVGLRKASLFHHFESKDALYATVLTGLLDGVVAAVSGALAAEGTFAVRLEALTEAITAILVEQPHAARLLIREAMDGGRNGPADQAALAARLHDVLAAAVAFLESGQRENIVRPDLDPRHLVLTLLGMHFLPFLIDRSVEGLIGRSPFDPGFVAERALALRGQVRALLFVAAD